jgi:hypothetical protein
MVLMEDSFDQQARIAELLAETEALDWDLDWQPDGQDVSEGAAGWAPDSGVGLDPDAGADPVDPDGAAGLENTDPVVRRWRIEQIVASRAEMARLQALELRHLAALTETVQASTEPGSGGENMELAFRSLTAELTVACRVSARTMQARLGEGHLLSTQYPATLAALQSGRSQAGHVRIILLHGRSIADAEARARYEGIVLQKAALVTPGRLAKHAQLTAARVGKVSFEDRHRKAREARYVRLTDDDDGMSTVSLYVPTLLAAAIWDRLTQQAKRIHRAATHPDSAGDADTAAAGDPRCFDQIRADLACELLLTGQPSGGPGAPHAAGIGIQAEVSVVIPVLSLLGQPAVEDAQPDPAMLLGHGPIGLDDARVLAADAPELVRILTHPITGMVLNVDTYRPSSKLRRFLRTRDGRCRFPVCNRNPRRTDIDHTFDWDYGGKTAPDNLECLCRGDHTLKHHSAWTVRQISPGVLEWTSPLGQIITDLPDGDIPGSTAPF